MKNRRKSFLKCINAKWSKTFRYSLLVLTALAAASLNCGNPLPDYEVGSPPPAAAEEPSEAAVSGLLSEDSLELLSDQLWADAPGSQNPGVSSGYSSKISLDVRDANILDVLSLLSVKLNAQIIYLEEPVKVTFKSENLSPISTLELLLHKYSLDYLHSTGYYLVGSRNRLYADFYNQMFITRYKTTYISAQTLQSLIEALHIPVENVTVDVNSRQIWVQGTPPALGKFQELIAAVDQRENAEFDTGGSRVIRMPVSYASGEHAEEELRALMKLLVFLLDGEINDYGWDNWDHPSVEADWDDPTVIWGEIKFMISPDLANNAASQIRYLLVEATPDHVNLVREMIVEIRESMDTLPFTFSPEEEEP